MKEAIRAMFAKYNCSSKDDYKNALKEIIQEVILLGLSRTDFFSRASFYGGSALRIVYQLDRFSEDLDFSLIKGDKDFAFEKYFGAIKDEATAFGFVVDINSKAKNLDSSIESAFLKGNTIEHLIRFPEIVGVSSAFNKNDQIKIKIEIDTDPPASDGRTEVKNALLPIPFDLRVYDLPSLFAGKLHAIICRRWKTRVKGRDYYDMCWYTARNVSVNYDYLSSKLKQSGILSSGADFGATQLEELLLDRVREIDIENAKKDVRVFLKHPHAVDPWSLEFFDSIIHSICRQ